MRRVSSWTGLAGVVAFAATGIANALPSVSDTGDYGNLWNINDTSGNNGTSVSGNVYWDIFDDMGTLYFGFSIVNTTSIANSDTRITGFGWDAPAGVTMSNGFSSLGWGFGFGGQTLPGEADAFDACTYGGPNCGAGGNTGIHVGDGFNYFFVQLNSILSAEALEEGFSTQRGCLRIISIPTSGPGSGNGSGSDVACRGADSDGGGDDGGDGGDLPEPGSLALFGLGLIALGLSRRRTMIQRA